MIKAIEVTTTWQGEGPDIGKRMLLIRFKKCDRVEEKRACKWCDTLVKMRITEEAEYSLEHLQEIIINNNLGCMITGGEPLYDTNFNQSINLLNNLDYPFANVETNGYNLKQFIKQINPSKNVTYIYSPKFFNKEELKIEIKRTSELLNELNVKLKVVYNDSDLMDEYLTHVNSIGLNDRTYLMPKGVTRDEIIKNSQDQIFEVAEFYKMNFSSREHIIYEFV